MIFLGFDFIIFNFHNDNQVLQYRKSLNFKSKLYKNPTFSPFVFHN